MAKENVPGKYRVDTELCIDCDVCRQTAPEIFGHDEEEGVAYVCKQPETEEDEELCHEAMESCPVEAICEDGEE
jgi:ferredoxin